jgi:hypothetical protein
MTLESLSRPDVSVASQEGVKTDQTAEITNIVKLLQKNRYHPPTEYAPHGKILCPDGEWRHIIGHDTTIDKGVHVSYGLQQNIVVDFDSDKVLQTCYKYAAPSLEGMNVEGTGTKAALEHLSRLTGSFLPYNEQKVIDYLRESNQKPDGEFQKLGDFVRMSVQDGRIVGAGICLHQALLCGGILEHAIEEGAISGRTAVFRNHDFEAKSAHAWVYTRMRKMKCGLLILRIAVSRI